MSRMFSIVFLVGMLIAGSVFAQPAPELAAAGEKALDEGKFDAAVQAFTQLIAKDSADVGAHFNLAIAYSLMGQDAKAIPEYRKVLELEPDVYEAHLNLGQVLLRSKQGTDALPHLKRAHEQKPSDFRAAFFLGEALFETGKPADAIDAYASAAAIDGKSASAELGWGRALAQSGRLSDAEPHYRKAITLDSQLQPALLELAGLFEKAGQDAKAITILKEFPKDAAALEHSGLLALRSGQNAEAIEALEVVVQTAPTASSRLALAEAYVKDKQLAKATPLLAKAVADEPQNFELLMFYARILRDQKRPADAAKEFLAASKLNSSSAEAWSELAGSLILMEQYPAALSALDRVKQLGSEKIGHLFFRATTLDHMNMRQEALDQYKVFLDASKEQNPDQEFQARTRIRMLEKDLGKR